MEYIDGPDMREMIQTESCQDEEMIRDIAIKLIDGIKYLHENDIIHRDIKPENIIFTKDMKSCKLLDLGISSNINTDCSGVKGTMRYMSPE